MITALAANPQLPHEIVEAAKEIGRRVLGQDGYDAFCAEMPSPWDMRRARQRLPGLVGREPGGIATVPAILGRWGDLEADFQRHYGLDARGVWKAPGQKGFIGVRRFLSLARRLPDDALSRTTPEIRLQAAQARAWDTSTELLAQLVDLVGVMAADKRIQGDPQRIPRPDWIGAGAQQDGRPGQRARPGGPGRDGYAHALGVLRRSTSKNTDVTAAAG